MALLLHLRWADSDAGVTSVELAPDATVADLVQAAVDARGLTHPPELRFQDQVLGDPSVSLADAGVSAEATVDVLARPKVSLATYGEGRVLPSPQDSHNSWCGFVVEVHAKDHPVVVHSITGFLMSGDEASPPGRYAVFVSAGATPDSGMTGTDWEEVRRCDLSHREETELELPTPVLIPAGGARGFIVCDLEDGHDVGFGPSGGPALLAEDDRIEIRNRGYLKQAPSAERRTLELSGTKHGYIGTVQYS
eukprot:TRINITY_DN30090_c0_g1_i2.p1 TRINITY_DN30090_c0_g1~~TRINITY_DN30090_c0_g1_i2.p1  ORF type:complete len:250 (+),score=28.78 TRINITY_DN30090_c0_g1_i2:97-846(+)